VILDESIFQKKYHWVSGILAGLGVHVMYVYKLRQRLKTVGFMALRPSTAQQHQQSKIQFGNWGRDSEQTLT
jgi:hypothetical protein